MSLLPFLCPSFALAELQVKEPAGPIDIEADSISYDREADAYEAHGQVKISFPGGTLQADSLLLEKGANIASAAGQVIIRTEGDVLEGDRVVFDIATSRGVVYGGKIFISQSHFYLRGDKIEKTGEASYHVLDASLSTCDGETPDWRITEHGIRQRLYYPAFNLYSLFFCHISLL